MKKLILSRLTDYSRLMRLHKPAGILLLLWPTLWALWIAANGVPPLKILLIFVAGVIVMRSAGCVINDFADRNLDLHVKRTQTRPLTSGKITAREAIILFLALCLLAFGLVLLLNEQTILLSIVAVMLAAIYPFMKRFTHFPQVFLGVTFAWGIPMAFTALTKTLSSQTWGLLLIAILWTIIYDTQYAMADREDDIKIGIKSTAIFFGQWDILIIGLLYLGFFSGLILLGMAQHFGVSYYFFLMPAFGLAIYQMVLIKDRSPSHCLKSFLNNQWLGMLIFLGISVSYL